LKPLTIFVTKDIAACEQIAEDWVDFLADHEAIDREDASKQVLVVTSSKKHEPNVALLSTVDSGHSPVHWIFSVSMLTEGWDVKNVFQIVPHEKRAFNSKLLIAQVLGRGLRIPDPYAGKRPTVTVFNHDSWSGDIKHLVEEVLEIEKRLISRSIPDRTAFHFDLHQIDYSREPETRAYAQNGEYDLLKKGYVDLPSQLPAVTREVEYERAGTGEHLKRKTQVTVRMYTVDDVASHVYERLRSIDHETEALSDPELRTSYAKKYGRKWCADMIRESVRRAGEKEDRVSEENRQKILQALGPLQRGIAKTVRYQLRIERVFTVSTTNRPANSMSLSVLRRGEAAMFYGPHSRETFRDQELSIFDEATGPETDLPGKAIRRIENGYCFKTPLNVVFSQHDPERRFLGKLFDLENAEKIDMWIKSTDRDFYPIEFSWKKGEHTKRASFNPDFFIKQGSSVFVVEVKDDLEVADPSEENRKKAEFGLDHFARVNKEQDELGYQLNFLSPRDFDAFFQKLRAEDLEGYRSHLDVALARA